MMIIIVVVVVVDDDDDDYVVVDDDWQWRCNSNNKSDEIKSVFNGYQCDSTDVIIMMVMIWFMDPKLNDDHESDGNQFIFNLMIFLLSLHMVWFGLWGIRTI